MDAHELLKARTDAALTQTQLASLTGITARTIRRIENGEHTPHPLTAQALTAALNDHPAHPTKNTGADAKPSTTRRRPTAKGA